MVYNKFEIISENKNNNFLLIRLNWTQVFFIVWLAFFLLSVHGACFTGCWWPHGNASVNNVYKLPQSAVDITITDCRTGRLGR